MANPQQIKARLLALEKARPSVPEWEPVELFAQILKHSEMIKAGNIKPDDLDENIRLKVLKLVEIWDQLETEC